jgi:hypothetical protein
MADRTWVRTASAGWPLTYRIITAISVGILLGVWHWFPGATARSELLFIGLIVGMYTAASVVHYYRVTRTDRVSAGANLDEG